jgi:hypothetical protein
MVNFYTVVRVVPISYQYFVVTNFVLKGFHRLLQLEAIAYSLSIDSPIYFPLVWLLSLFLHRAWWAVCADSCSLEIAFDSTMGVKRD